MKNIRVKIREYACTGQCDYGIYEGKKRLMGNDWRHTKRWGLTKLWQRKSYAIKAAKAMAKRIGIKFASEIIREHGC